MRSAIHQRRAALLVGAMTLVAAVGCSSSPTGTSGNAATSVPGTAPGNGSSAPLAADVQLIEEAFAARAAAWDQGARVALDQVAQHAYPPGAWTADSVSLAFRRQAADERGQPVLTFEEWVEALDRAGYRGRTVVDPATVTLDPDWTIPEGRPGAGTRPEGRVYRLEATVVSNAADNGTKVVTRVTVIGDRVLGFPEP